MDETAMTEAPAEETTTAMTEAETPEPAETTPNPPFGIKEGPGNLVTFATQVEFDRYVLALAVFITQDRKRILAARSV